MNIHIETNRFILRDLEASDVDDMFELDSDPKVHLYLGNRPISTKEEAATTIAAVQKQYQESGIGRWAIIDKLTNSFIGWTGLKLETKLRPERQYYDLGYRLKSKYWAKGIATETAMASLQYGFNTLNLEKICAAAHPDNIASNTILKKIGLNFMETFEFDDETINWYTLDKPTWKQL